MSEFVDVKPVFESIRVKKEPLDYNDDSKPKKPTVVDMVRRRRAVLRRGRKKRKKRRKKRRTKPKAVGKIIRAISGAKKALVYNLGFDPQKERSLDFNPVIPDEPSLPDSEEKDLEQEKEDSTTSSAPPEDLLDIILGKQEELFADKPTKKTLSLKEIEEREEKKRKRQEKIEEKQKREQERLKEAKMKEREARDKRKREDQSQQNQSPVKRKSRFSDDIVTNLNNQFPVNLSVPSMTLINKPPSPPKPQLPLPNPSLVVDPNLLSIIQNNLINQNIQQAIRNQQMNNEFLQIQAVQTLYGLQNPFIPPPQPPLAPVLQPTVSYGLPMPPPPPPDPNILNYNNTNGMNYMIPPPPPASELPSTSYDEDEGKIGKIRGKHEHVQKVAAVVKPLAEKYGKKYRLSSEDYKKMCKTIVKKVAKYNSSPKPERVQHLVEEYAQYLRNKSEKHK